GHGVVVVVQAPLCPHFRHAGVLVNTVILADPLVGLLEARVVARDAAVDQALDAGVGHAAVARQAAVGGGVVLHLGRAAAGGAVDEAAVVDLVAPLLVVGLALEVLAAADEAQRFLHRRVVARYARGLERVEEELRVRQVGPRLAVVAGAAVEVVGRLLAVVLVPLQLLEELDGVADDGLVAVAVGGGQR